jgi:hypothetical protein
MLNANHWFVAYDRGAELRIGAWTPNKRLRAAARHLCGHKCLHKLVDDYMARTFNTLASSSVESTALNTSNCNGPIAGTSLTWVAPHKMQAVPIIGSHVEDFESSAQLVKPAESVTLQPASGPTALRADAWKRERERQRDGEPAARSRRSIA